MLASLVHPSKVVAALAATIVSAGCSEPVTAPAVLCPRIVHGQQSPSVVQLQPSQRAAIVAVYPDTREAICSGVIVAPGVALTAAHCAEAFMGTSISVGAWAEGQPAATVTKTMVHPRVDVAVLWFPAALGPPGVEPVALHEGTIDEGWLDHAVQLAGWGLSEHGEVGTLRFVAEPLVDFDADTFTVDGRGQTGACGGDSGGPALALDDRGRLRVVGLLDAGDPSCRALDVYTRTDPLASWWPFAWRSPISEQQQCSTLGPAGVCVRDGVVWCDGVGVRHDVCDPDRVCGLAEDAARFACIAPQDDTCRDDH
ncbi:MAG: trypsin-like serine protease [Deltaproteobacteria bacterium]|nr:trypsin-like serine protease [Deltaproteobacteria bacterium]